MNNLALKLPLQERSGFAELVAGLSRKPNEIVAMLWAYFHESGEHSLDGTLTRLTIGGLIALLEAWQAFEMDWNTTLAKARLREFHGRTTPPQTAEEFTEIIGRHIPIGLGYTAVGAKTAEAYEKAFVDCLLQHSSSAFHRSIPHPHHRKRFRPSSSRHGG